MLALAVEGALTQAFDPGHDGPVLAAHSKFEADGLFDGLTLSDVIKRQFFHRKTNLINFNTKLLSIKDHHLNGPQKKDH